MNLTDNAKEINTNPAKTSSSVTDSYAGNFIYNYNTSFGVGYYPLTPSQVLKAFLSKFGL